LSRLFHASNLESASLVKELHLSDQMGLFLQKTNIIRDYLEDYVDGRAFWPQTIWKKYSQSGDLGYFADQSKAENREASRQCLNELVTDALELVPDCLMYLSKLTCPEVFRFCAIPQVMAIATLESLYNNLNVFTGVVKIRKGMACKLVLNSSNVTEVHNSFNAFAKSIETKAKGMKAAGIEDGSYERTMKACKVIIELTDEAYISKRNRGILYKCFVPMGVVLASSSYQRYSRLGEIESYGISSTLIASSLAFGWTLHSFGFGSKLQAEPKKL